ncbi:MAG: hypothetical protein IJV10_01300 [Prevotella sp.]|nr:hypothetical protein [Prevotella sp.]MBR1839788.1 hypothetical protein [Prevotella sp.]
MKNNNNSGNPAVSAVCTVLFVLITFLYFYSFQGDVIGMTQYSWSDHETSYDRLTGGVIFTAIAILISFVTSLVLSFPQRIKTLVFLPAMMLSGLVTSGTVDDMGNVSISWGLVGFSVVVLTLFPFAIRLINHYVSYFNSSRDGSTPVTPWCTNILVLLLSTMLMYGMGNTDRTLHTRLAVERLCHEGRFGEALALGIPQHDNDKALTMWRAYALSRQSMGERLFCYNFSSSQSTLLPRTDGEPHALLRDCYPIWQSIGFVPRTIDERSEVYLQRELRRGTARKAAIDYLLCTNLINKDLRSFGKNVARYYTSADELPQHYAEALMLVHNDTLRVSNAVRADYADFLAMMRSKKPKKEKQADLRDNYFGTYWYYYYRN